MKKIIATLLALTVFILSFSGCVTDKIKNFDLDTAFDFAMETADKYTNTFAFDETNFPKIGVYPLFEGVGKGLIDVILGEDENFDDYMVVLDYAEGYKKLKKGEIDIYIGYETEKKAGLLSYSLGKDALVFFTRNENNEIELTSKQIEKIYSGKITDGSLISEKSKKIYPYACKEGTWSDFLFKKFFDIKSTTLVTNATYSEKNGIMLSDAMYVNKSGALGYGSYIDISNSDKSEFISLISVEGFEASSEYISGGMYPFCLNVNVTVKDDTDEGSSVMILYNWFSSAQGEEFCENMGF